MKSFLGLAGYYRRYIKDFSKIASPLNQLVQRYISHPRSLFGNDWNLDCQNAFNTLKQHLVCSVTGSGPTTK